MKNSLFCSLFLSCTLLSSFAFMSVQAENGAATDKLAAANPTSNSKAYSLLSYDSAYLTRGTYGFRALQGVVYDGSQLSQLIDDKVYTYFKEELQPRHWLLSTGAKLAYYYFVDSEISAFLQDINNNIAKADRLHALGEDVVVGAIYQKDKQKAEYVSAHYDKLNTYFAVGLKDYLVGSKFSRYGSFASANDMKSINKTAKAYYLSNRMLSSYSWMFLLMPRVGLSNEQIAEGATKLRESLKEHAQGLIDSSGSTDKLFIYSAATFNSNMALAQTLEDAAWYAGASHARKRDGGVYSSAKLANFMHLIKVYRTTSIADAAKNAEDEEFLASGKFGDLYGILEHYNASSTTKITLGQLTAYSVVPLLSRQFICDMAPAINFVYKQLTGSSINVVDADNLEYNRIRLPNINMFLNTKGISYRLSSGYRYAKDIFIPFAVEGIVSGEQELEASIGLRKAFNNNVFMQGETTVNKSGVGYASFYLGYMAEAYNLYIEIGVSAYKQSSLVGMRNIGKYAAPNTAEYALIPEFWLKLGARY